MRFMWLVCTFDVANTNTSEMERDSRRKIETPWHINCTQI